MPYSIVPFEDGYRVVSENGHILSHKPLTYDQAKAQATAVRIHEFGGGGKDWYLNMARARARAYGINNLEYADDGKHKFQITTPDGKVRRFGLKNYHDYLLWQRVEMLGGAPEGTADIQRKKYLSRATKIKGNWKADKYSPNNLAIHILW
jgi:hypothetical protein